MRTTNPELLAEIDGLCQMSGVESHQLEVVKRIEQLEKQVEFEYNLKVQARTQWDDLSKHLEELENQLNNK